MQTFGNEWIPSSVAVSLRKDCKYLIIMQNNLSIDGLYINAFHRENSMAAQREVQRMSLHPLSREQKMAQISELRRMATISKENSNAERSRLNA